jgi:2,3-diaminopropionate biosynthesis protein SbnB
MTLLLTQRDLLACGAADFELAATALEEMFRIHAAGDFTAPPSSFLKRPERPHVADRFIGLAAHLGGSFDIEGIKWIGSAHENPSRGLPRANAVIVLNDAETRLPLAIMEGGLVSALRTAVVQGLAARRLARADARSVGVVGAGRIAALTLHLLHTWFPALVTFRCFDLDVSRADRFADHMEKLGVRVEVMSRYEEAVAEADIALAATTAQEAYLDPECFRAGSLFLNVSLMDPTFAFVQRADKIVVDDWEQCIHSDRVLARMHRAGLLDRQQVHAEFGEIIVGSRPGRETNDERIFFNPFGLAIEDLAVATSLYRRARDLGIGQSIDLIGAEWEVLC